MYYFIYNYLGTSCSNYVKINNVFKKLIVFELMMVLNFKIIIRQGIILVRAKY